MEKDNRIDLFETVAEVEQEIVDAKAQAVKSRIHSLLDDIDGKERAIKSLQKTLQEFKTQLAKIKQGDWTAIPESGDYLTPGGLERMRQYCLGNIS